ncbi:MAG: thioredoxin domain-containing protein, partial [Dinghuibacter sp.]|nr:thioredoxin domain-containing protein [Dinghuibacter sp.]
PFYGGTYFPPQRAYNRPSWKEVLVMVHTAWRERRHEITSQADGLLEHLAKQTGWGNNGPATFLFNNDVPIQAAERIMANAEKKYGGFGQAPKFPQFGSIGYLVEHHHYYGNEAAWQHALFTINQMRRGGIYDHAGGGLARYSTDDRWLVPHFEKMMYDNALFVPLLCDALLLTGNKEFETTIHEILSFLQREMMNPECAFYTAIDADSEGVEGRFYTWELKEIEALLGEDAPEFCAFFGITEQGNWKDPHHPELPPVNILNMRPDAALPSEKIKNGLAVLFAERGKRVRPLTDDKILLSLNAMANRAFSRAYAATGHTAYREVAEKNMAFLLKHFPAGNAEPAFSTGAKHQLTHDIPAFLDDYAFLVQALIELQEITGNTAYLLPARTLLEYVLEHFSDEEQVLFYYTRAGQPDVIVRRKETYDGSQPSSNAVMCENLLKMALYFGVPEWEKRGVAMLENMGEAIGRYPASFSVWAQVLQRKVNGYFELAVTGKGAGEALPVVLKNFIPARVLMAQEKDGGNWPMLMGKCVDNELNIHVCKDNTCFPPVKIPEHLGAQLVIFTGIR